MADREIGGRSHRLWNRAGALSRAVCQRGKRPAFGCDYAAQGDGRLRLSRGQKSSVRSTTIADNSIGLVVVTTPNQPTSNWLNRRWKPVSTSYRQALRGDRREGVTLGQLAKSKGLLAIPFHNRRWDGDF